MALPLLPIALLGSAAIGGITSLLSSRSAGDAQDRASDEARETAQRQEAFEREIINRQLMQSAPYAATGYGALGDLATAYGQDMPRGFNPYAPLGQEGGFTDPSNPGGLDPAQLQKLLQLLNEDGDRDHDDDDDDDDDEVRTRVRDGVTQYRIDGEWTTTPPAPPPSSTIPSDITTGNALADYLNQYRNRIDKDDRTKFDEYITQIRSIGSLTPQAGFVDPNSPQGLQSRRDDYIARFKSSPLYQLNYQSMMDEGNRGVSRNASASGLLNSGRTLKALQDRAGDISSRLYGSYEGGLWNMAGWQQPTPASAGVSSAIGNQAQPANFANAAGIQGAGNAVNNALGSFAYLQGLGGSSSFAKTQDRL